MPIEEFFPQRPLATPMICAYASTHPDHAGLLKVGYTEWAAADRMAERAITTPGPRARLSLARGMINGVDTRQHKGL